MRITNKLSDNWDDNFNNHHELPPEEFQFRIGEQCIVPTDCPYGDRKVNKNSPTDHSEGERKVNNNSPSYHKEGANYRSIETNLSPHRDQVGAIN